MFSSQFCQSANRVLRVAFLGLSLTLLSACATVTWECKVGGTVNKPKNLDKSGATINARVGGSLVGNSAVAAAASMVGLSSAINSNSITMDTSGSSVQWPQSGTVLLTIKNKSSGQVLSAKSFAWLRAGSIVKFANPVSVDSWLSTSGAGETTHKVDYEFQSLIMPAQEGSNLIAVDVYQGGQPKSTASATISYEPCTPTPYYDCQPI